MTLFSSPPTICLLPLELSHDSCDPCYFLVSRVIYRYSFWCLLYPRSEIHGTKRGFSLSFNSARNIRHWSNKVTDRTSFHTLPRRIIFQHQGAKNISLNGFWLNLRLIFAYKRMSNFKEKYQEIERQADDNHVQDKHA